MTPKTEISQVFRNAVLEMASRAAFAQAFVNSGRLSVPCVYDDFLMFGEDTLDGPARTRPGAACSDAPVEGGYLLDHITGEFTLLALGGNPPTPIPAHGITTKVIHLPAVSAELAERYLGATKEAVYLIRPR